MATGAEPAQQAGAALAAVLGVVQVGVIAMQADERDHGSLPRVLRRGGTCDKIKGDIGSSLAL